MSGRTLLLATCVAALVGGGYWLGRSSSASAPAPAVVSAAPARTASLPVIGPHGAVAGARTMTPPALPSHAGDPTLAADLVDRDPKIRSAAIREAAQDSNVDVKLLLDASRDRDLEVSLVATVALGKAYSNGRVAVTELATLTQDHSLDEKVRMAALNGLGLVASADAAALLARLATNGDAGERASAAILLQHQDLDLAVPALIHTLGDADAHVREVAHQSLKARSRGRDFGEDRAAWQAWWDSRR
jgi:hypothetical protein